LRVGNLRVIFDLLNEDRVLHVMAVLDRRDLDRWLRRR
jgi:mRNA-degrading endonuclease RelE of RelBE toxin-antitoxin system